MKTIELIPLKQFVTKTIGIPGSKSYTNRALIMAALTKGSVKLLNPLISDDTEAMMNCLTSLGIKITKFTNEIIVENDIFSVKDQRYELFANLSGTTIRFILALACIIPGVKKIYGGEGLNKRPIKDLVLALNTAGAEITYEHEYGFPPVVVSSSFLPSGTITVNGSISSQFLSALLMISPLIGGVTIRVEGKQISKSYVDITLSMMKEWGIQVENKNYQQYVIRRGQQYKMSKYIIEGDYSAAGYFAAIAALTNSTITLINLNKNSVQGDKKCIDILEEMGNEIKLSENQVTIIGKSIKPMNVDMEQCPDQAQTLSVLLAFANGTSKLTGVRSLRVKETERVKAIQNELHKMGIQTESPDEDTLIIHGGNPHSAIIDTYGDHRMAMSFAVAGSTLSGMKINDPDVVNKTFPSFWEKLNLIGIGMIFL